MNFAALKRHWKIPQMNLDSKLVEPRGFEPLTPTERAMNAMNELNEYIRHKSDCALNVIMHGMGQSCSCGLDNVRARILTRNILNICEKCGGHKANGKCVDCLSEVLMQALERIGHSTGCDVIKCDWDEDDDACNCGANETKRKIVLLLSL
jgi:hypothetical protein